jgi:hypothetical protein
MDAVMLREFAAHMNFRLWIPPVTRGLQAGRRGAPLRSSYRHDNDQEEFSAHTTSLSEKFCSLFETTFNGEVLPIVYSTLQLF